LGKNCSYEGFVQLYCSAWNQTLQFVELILPTFKFIGHVKLKYISGLNPFGDIHVLIINYYN
jgi:hypothetical protein